MSEEQLKSYYLNCNNRLLNQVPPGLNRVLEFGCSGGMLGRKYKEANKDVTWHGIDIFEPALEHAKGLLDEAWCLNANDLAVNEIMLEEQYDALVYGDVIEHLIDPEQSVAKHLELLKPGGKLVVCIPNIQHWSVIKHVLSGNFAYADSGILDRTHLRFFTRKSFLTFLKNIGMDLIKMERISYENIPSFQRQAPVRQQMLDSLKVLCDGNNMPYSDYDFRTFQFIFIAEKRK